MKGELVFVPLIGSQPVEDWTKVPHIKVWGLWDAAEQRIQPIYIENGGAESLRVPTSLFEAEQAHIQVIEHGVTTVPEEVSVRLAQLAITGDFLS